MGSFWRGAYLMLRYARMMLGVNGGLDTQIVTVGGDGTAGGLDRRRGFLSSAAIGSISTGNSSLYSGAAIVALYYDETSNTVKLSITGASLANSGWTTLTIGTTAYTRASATYSGTSPTTWTWAAGTFASQPFSGIGTATNCVFT